MPKMPVWTPVSSAILDNGVKIHLSNNTEFLVRTGTNGDYTDTAYTGTRICPISLGRVWTSSMTPRI